MKPSSKKGHQYVFFKPYREQLQEEEKYSRILQSPPGNNYFKHRLTFSPSPTRNAERSYGYVGEYDNFNYKNYQEYKQHIQDTEDFNKNQSRKYPSKSPIKQKRRVYQMHEPVWEQLYNYGLQARKQIMEMHLNKINKIDTECTFSPLITKSDRYGVHSNSNFLQRNKIWYENRIEKIVKQKEEEVTKDLEHCTFKPKLNTSYKPSNHKASQKHDTNQKKLSNSKSMQKIRSRARLRDTHNQSNRQQSTQRDFNREEVGKIKNLIRRQLKKIQL